MRNPELFPLRRFVLTVIAVMLSTLWPFLPPASADSVLTNISLGSPSAVAVNPATNQVYVANADSNTLTVIDGATDAASRVIPVGSDPDAVAVDPATGVIYVACYTTNNIIAIDAANQTMNSISLGFSPLSVAVNQNTDKVYALGVGSSNVAVIDGSTLAVSSINATGSLKALAVDEATNNVYIVADGAVGTLAAGGLFNVLYSGAAPVAVAVNPDTGKVYVVDLGKDCVADINEFGITTTAVGSGPVAVAVDPATDLIYVADSGSNEVTAIDGTTDMSTNIGVGAHPVDVAVNPATDLIYAACEGSNEVTVIAGNNAVLPAPFGASTPGAAVNTAPANPGATRTVVSLTIGQNGYTVNGATYSSDVAPIISEGRTLIPIRDMAAALGASVSWDEAAQEVTVGLNGKTIELWIGQDNAKVNGAAVPIDSDPQVTPILMPPGRVMLPLRFVAESLGCQVNWNDSLQEITVTYPQP